MVGAPAFVTGVAQIAQKATASEAVASPSTSAPSKCRYRGRTHASRNCHLPMGQKGTNERYSYFFRKQFNLLTTQTARDGIAVALYKVA